jgi:hypothetical protein
MYMELNVQCISQISGFIASKENQSHKMIFFLLPINTQLLDLVVNQICFKTFPMTFLFWQEQCGLP